jgi:hypothetical protein
MILTDQFALAFQYVQFSTFIHFFSFIVIFKPDVTPLALSTFDMQEQRPLPLKGPASVRIVNLPAAKHLSFLHTSTRIQQLPR